MLQIQKIPNHIPLRGACNVRHLGGYAVEGGVTREFGFIRSDNPANLTDGDIALLLKLGVRCVIDLRNADEVMRSPNPFASVPTVSLHNIPVFPDNAFLRAFDHMARGESYCRILDECGSAYYEAIGTILQAGGNVLFHCAAGKDRTGLLAMLLLQFAGVDRETTAEEYAYTELLRADVMEQELRANPQLVREDFFRMHGTRREYMLEAIDHLGCDYGGIDGYLAAIGLSQIELQCLRKKMIREQSIKVLTA